MLLFFKCVHLIRDFTGSSLFWKLLFFVLWSASLKIISLGKSLLLLLDDNHNSHSTFSTSKELECLQSCQELTYLCKFGYRHCRLKIIVKYVPKNPEKLIVLFVLFFLMWGGSIIWISFCLIFIEAIV